MFRMDLPIKKSENIQWKLIEEKAVLLNLDEALVLELDELGTKIWFALDGSKCGNEVVDYIADNFEVAREEAEKDVSNFLKILLRDEAIAFLRKGVRDYGVSY